MIIDTPDPATAEDAVADFYAADLADSGVVFAHTRAMAVNPEALTAFRQLAKALAPSLGFRLYELATLGAARALASQHCLLAHGERMLSRGELDEDGIVHFAEDPATAGLTPAELAVVDYAAKLSTDASSMTDADTLALRAHGYTDRQIVDITLAAGIRNYFSRSLQALAVPVDAVPGLPARAADALLANAAG